MQNRKFLRVLLCLVVLALCVSLFPGHAEAKTDDDKIYPVFDLTVEKGDKTAVYTAFLVKDPASGNVYLVSAAEAGEMAEEADSITLVGQGYSEKADYLQTVGLISYFWAPELNEASSFTLGAPMPYTVLVSMLMEEKGELVVGISEPVLFADGWEDMGTYWLSSNVETGTERLGAAALTEKMDYVVGMISRNEEDKLVIFTLEGTVFPEDNAVVNAKGEVVTPPKDDPKPRIGVTAGISVGVGLAIAAAVALVVVANKKKSKPAENKSASGAVREATVPMKNSEMASDLVNIPGRTMPLKGSGNYQLRCVRGPMEGKTYFLNSSLTIGRSAGNDIQFPDGTKGVSGKHCRVIMAGDRVMLQDLGSTYGTFYGMDHKAKLQPNMDYPIQNGDVFVLAEGGPAFRLEKVGAVVANFSLRNAAGMVYKPNADGEITIGRGPGNVVAYDAANSSVSGRHCKVFIKDDALYLMDTGSTNGTFFSESQRLKPNVAYKITSGTKFFLVDERNTFTVTRD